MIRRTTAADRGQTLAIINDAARAYKGVIPADRYHEPYMTAEELDAEIADGVEFSCFYDGKLIIAVMGVQDRGDVRLLRHAYTRTSERGKGLGTKLIESIRADSKKPMLIGTWKDASWAIRFYEKQGFHLVDEETKNRLLKKYWNIPSRQVEESVVLSDSPIRL